MIHSRTKHIDIKYHFFKDHVLTGDVGIPFMDTHEQLAIIFTKPLANESIYKIIRELEILDENDI